MLGWNQINTLEGLQKLGVPDAVHGESVWVSPASYDSIRPYFRELNFDPWIDANDDLLILEHFIDLSPDEFGDYKDCLYHETRGHGTHAIWNYRKGKFANAAVMWLNR